MIKVITYGTYDLLHYGHIKLLERAKALGDYLIVGVTSDDYDKVRGKINNQQSLLERVTAVKELGIADEVIIEEYEGQKIDDIKRYGVDIFTVGSDWEGKFDYLNEYCKVIYLPRTTGVSSSDLRAERRKIRIGIVGDYIISEKFYCESKYVNGVEISGICANKRDKAAEWCESTIITESYTELVEMSDALYIASHPSCHYEQIKYGLAHGRHIICESPIAMRESQCEELIKLAEEKGLILTDAVKTAYSTAYARMLLLLKGEAIGKVVSVESTCTSLRDFSELNKTEMKAAWNSICAWGPTAMLPVFQILGVNYTSKQIISLFAKEERNLDIFTKINFNYSDATATVKVGKGVKSEGELIISGTKGYVYVPAPWWKTDYFEIRYEDIQRNRRYFYQLEGEGIRYEIVAFLRAIERGYVGNGINDKVTRQICSIIEAFETRTDLIELH